MAAFPQNPLEGKGKNVLAVGKINRKGESSNSISV